MWKDIPSPGKLKNPKLTLYILFFLHLGKGRFLAGWPEFWPTVVSYFNLFDITIVKVFQVIKNSLYEIWLFHSLNGGWHCSRAGLWEATHLLYSVTTIQRQNSGPILFFDLENSSTGCPYKKSGNLHEQCEACHVQTLNYYLNKCL